MTVLRVLAVSALVVAAALPAAGEGQRARIRPDSSDTPAADAAASKAAPRPQEERRAVERPARPVQEAPPAAAPAAEAQSASRQDSAPAREGGRRESRPTGPTIVTPSVSTPTTVGGVQVGEPFVVGSTFAVGHVEPQSEHDSSRRRGDDDRRTRRREVLVPVPVYVPVPVEVSESYGRDSIDAGAADPGTAFTSSRDVGDVRPAGDALRDAGSRLDRRRAAYFRFEPWFNVGNALLAGVPVPLPSPEAFDERNVSGNVLIETRDASLASGVRRQYAPGVGGVAFIIKPADAAVYIDGKFVGSGYDFGPDREPLLLPQGAYTLELRAEGFLVEKFPVYVTMGEVLPFSGAMVRIE